MTAATHHLRSPRHRIRTGLIVLLLLIAGSAAVQEATALSVSEQPASGATAGENPAEQDSAGWHPAWRVLLLTDYNVRIVVLGTALLGTAAGMIGSFTLLRRRALMGDALAHSTLPGIVAAWMLVTSLGGDGRAMPVLLTGAAVSGLIGTASVLALRRLTPLKEDAALGIVLSVFFGAGVALLGITQQMARGSAAGLNAFIYGRAASMGRADAVLIGVAACLAIAVCVLLFKELRLLCFDDAFAAACGFSVLLLDSILMALVVLITIVGLQAVGLILMIALLVIPAAAARFWSQRLQPMFLTAGILGGISGFLGAVFSALFVRAPSGAMIVLVCTGLFGVSGLLGSARGLLPRLRKRQKLNRSVDRQHLLRALFELQETRSSEDTSADRSRTAVPIDTLLEARSWPLRRLLREIRRARNEELIEWLGDRVRLTRRGAVEAERLTRQHRLWELYLITHADVAPARVDRDADAIEHVLEPEIVADLERLLEREQTALPDSPHVLTGPAHSTSSSERADS